MTEGEGTAAPRGQAAASVGGSRTALARRPARPGGAVASNSGRKGAGCSEAAFSPQANSEGVHSLPRSGDFGVRSTDVTTVNSCAGMQWFQHDSSAQAPDELLRRRRFAPHLQAEPGAPDRLSSAGTAGS
eukprot:CAMPEP_0177571522 /NCGR_PEP_ID=MMETSP0369-20130122/77475_1 /TAXON_ID=447022 ORGANISM="Scrippsiella hangoei-like, Strain SHHI-4" /NCGR_SAMPLE_ID=MMETSP0369 /ASSEMBLY_ACC=CAM_ASM_000364 /LENGTH=129 /DNA_ID=CAMNT_0019059445 /DNA_START=66 /DNA_END=455 /DNA_ORIENTATION=+